MISNYRKAEWIANQMIPGTNADDVLDVLLGNITEQSSFVAEVEGFSKDYDSIKERNFRRVM